MPLGVALGVFVGVGVRVGVFVGVKVGVLVGVRVGVAVAFWTITPLVTLKMALPVPVSQVLVLPQASM